MTSEFWSSRLQKSVTINLTINNITKKEYDRSNYLLFCGNNFWKFVLQIRIETDIDMSISYDLYPILITAIGNDFQSSDFFDISCM